MDRDSIKELLREVVGPNTELVDHPKWVGLRCPFAAWKHAKGSDKAPSAGISIKENGDPSIFNCYVCGKGTVSWFLKEMEKYTGENHSAMIAEVEGDEFLGGSVPEWGTKTNDNQPLEALSPDYDDLYDPVGEHWYLTERGITPETAASLGLLLDPEDSRGDERILFPVRGLKGELYGFTGRAVMDDIEPRVRDYHGLPKHKLLLGLDTVASMPGPIALVEGLFDRAFVHQCGYPALAVMHAGLTPQQAEWLVSLGRPVVLMYDNDQAGDDGTEIAVGLLERHIPLLVAYYPRRRKQPNSRRGQKGTQWEEPKDPATCTEAEIKKMMAEAELR